MDAEQAPLASVIIPLYHSGGTLQGCLEALAAQTERRFETVLVDSSEDDGARAIAGQFERTTYLHSEKRLRPQAARNFGAARACGPLLVFTDPDIYPSPVWMATLLGRYMEAPAILFGPIACHGRRWVDRGVHLCKFNICLPGGSPRPVRLGWSGNVLIARSVFDSLGGWDTAHMQGDSVFSARARVAGCELRLEPDAVVFHDHEGISLAGLFKERFVRGREFAGMEAAGELGALPRGVSRPADVLRRVAVMPLRVLGGVRRVGRAAARAGLIEDYFLTLPAVLLGLIGWYAGLADGWRRSMSGRPAQPRDTAALRQRL